MSSNNPTDNNNNAPPSGSAPTGNRGRRKPNRQQDRARAAFNASAPPMSVEKFFTEWTEARRNNVDVVYDNGFMDRVAAPYVERARNHTTYVIGDPDDNTLSTSTYAMIGLGVVRKLLMTVPESQNFEVASMKDLLDQEFFLPKAAIAAIDNVGKFEVDDFVCRLKYQTQDVARSLIAICKVMNNHPRFRGRFTSPQWPNRNAPGVPNRDATWDDVPLDNVIVPSRASATWIRDQAKAYLDRAYQEKWEMTDANGHVFQVTYPHLPISMSREAQERNVTDWLPLLSEHMPNVEKIVCAGICTAWDELWFTAGTFQDLGLAFPDWVPSPLDVLREMNLWRVSFVAGDFVAFVREVGNYLPTIFPHLHQVFDMARQPENKFGSEAQLIVIPEAAMIRKPFIGIDGFNYFDVRQGTQGRAVIKVKNKGLVTVGSIFRLALSVEVRDNYLATVNGNPSSLKIQYLRSDFKNNFF